MASCKFSGLFGIDLHSDSFCEYLNQSLLEIRVRGPLDYVVVDLEQHPHLQFGHQSFYLLHLSHHPLIVLLSVELDNLLLEIKGDDLFLQRAPLEPDR